MRQVLTTFDTDSSANIT